MKIRIINALSALPVLVKQKQTVMFFEPSLISCKIFEMIIACAPFEPKNKTNHSKLKVPPLAFDS